MTSSVLRRYVSLIGPSNFGILLLFLFASHSALICHTFVVASTTESYCSISEIHTLIIFLHLHKGSPQQHFKLIAVAQHNIRRLYKCYLAEDGGCFECLFMCLMALVVKV